MTFNEFLEKYGHLVRKEVLWCSCLGELVQNDAKRFADRTMLKDYKHGNTGSLWADSVTHMALEIQLFKIQDSTSEPTSSPLGATSWHR